jgi:hypothetical protein
MACTPAGASWTRAGPKRGADSLAGACEEHGVGMPAAGEDAEPAAAPAAGEDSEPAATPAAREGPEPAAAAHPALASAQPESTASRRHLQPLRDAPRRGMGTGLAGMLPTLRSHRALVTELAAAAQVPANMSDADNPLASSA